jgi:hypothetical protein
VELGRYSVIVVPDDDEQIAAFHNVCRHRGSRILLESGQRWQYSITAEVAALFYRHSARTCALPSTRSESRDPTPVKTRSPHVRACLVPDQPDARPEDGLQRQLVLTRASDIQPLPAVRTAAQKLDAVLLILDPLTSRLSDKLDTHKDAEVRHSQPLPGLYIP